MQVNTFVAAARWASSLWRLNRGREDAALERLAAVPSLATMFSTI
jgi:hypothetical protein